MLTRGLGFFFLSFDTSGAKLGHRATGYLIHVHVVLFQYAYRIHFLVNSKGRGVAVLFLVTRIPRKNDALPRMVTSRYLPMYSSNWSVRILSPIGNRSST